MRVFESESGGTIPAHAEAFDEASFALGDGSVAAVDVGHQLFDKLGFEFDGVVFPIAPHAERQSVGKD